MTCSVFTGELSNINGLSKDGKCAVCKRTREEHNPPASTVGASLLGAIANNSVEKEMLNVRKNYSQSIISKFDDSKIDDAGLASKLSKGKDVSDDPALRYAESGIDLETLKNLETGEIYKERIE